VKGEVAASRTPAVHAAVLPRSMPVETTKARTHHARTRQTRVRCQEEGHAASAG